MSCIILLGSVEVPAVAWPASRSSSNGLCLLHDDVLPSCSAMWGCVQVISLNCMSDSAMETKYTCSLTSRRLSSSLFRLPAYETWDCSSFLHSHREKPCLGVRSAWAFQIVRHWWKCWVNNINLEAERTVGNESPSIRIDASVLCRQSIQGF